MESLLASDFMVKLRYRSQVAKLPLCLLVSFSSLFGFLYAAQAWSLQAVQVFVAVLTLSCGAASLNSYQERLPDALMQRTRNRPLVKKKITDTAAFTQSVVLLISGLLMLLISANVKSFMIGILAVFLYNFTYTRMKAVSLHAIIPGAICGAIPPYIGWLAVGGEIISLRAAMPVLLLFFWQIPHFLLVLLNHEKDYISSISPNLLKELSESTLRRIFPPWIAALSATMLAFNVLPSAMNLLARSLITINAFFLFGVFIRQLIRTKPANYGQLFRQLNISLFFIMSIICVDAL